MRVVSFEDNERGSVMMDKSNALIFDDIRVHVRLKLFALWTSVMFFYIY